MPVSSPTRALAAMGVRPASELAGGARAAPTGDTGVYPVPEALASLLPAGGIVAGSTVAVRGTPALLLAILAAATAGGAWAALVGMPEVGLLAAAELGVPLSRLAVVEDPGSEAPRVLAALLDGIDMVAVAGDSLTGNTARRLSARARHRRAVLLPRCRWPGADIDIRCRGEQWSGVGDGAGRLREHRLSVSVTGRGAAAREAGTDMVLPSGSAPAPEQAALRVVS